MSKYLFIVCAALLVTMSAGAQMVSTSQPYSGVTQNPCNGELVDFSGSIYFHEKTQIANDGRIHFVSNNNFNASGRGRNTGVTYNIGGIMQTNSKFPSYPITFRQRSRFVSTSSAVPSFFATYAFRVNGAGVPSTVSSTSDCN